MKSRINVPVSVTDYTPASNLVQIHVEGSQLLS